MKRLAFVLVALVVARTLSAAERPNVVYFLVDDMGFADCGFNGGSDVKTPVIDSLSASGTVFQNYYVQPVCSTSRASLLTGRLPIRHGIYGALKNNSQYGLPIEERTLPQALRSAGYETAICGKWHLGDAVPEFLPMQRGFDHQYGLRLGQIDYYTHVSADGFGRRPDWFRDDKPCDDQGYSTQLLAKEAVRLIHDRKKDKPLFLYLPFNAVHGPWMAPPSYEAPFQQLPPNRRTVVAMMATVDEAIGQVMAALKAAGIADQTLVIFSSDNGGPRPGDRAMNTPLRDGKGSIYEGGIRSAAFAVLPGRISAGKKTATPVQLIDWYPTLLGLAGADTSQPLPVDGVDLWPLLTEGKSLSRDAILVAGSPDRYALRMGDWKLLVNPKPSAGGGEGDEGIRPATADGPTVELYNLAEDVAEAKNLAASQSERLKVMRERGTAMMKGAAASLADAKSSPARPTRPEKP